MAYVKPSVRARAVPLDGGPAVAEQGKGHRLAGRSPLRAQVVNDSVVQLRPDSASVLVRPQVDRVQLLFRSDAAVESWWVDSGEAEDDRVGCCQQNCRPRCRVSQDLETGLFSVED